MSEKRVQDRNSIERLQRSLYRNLPIYEHVGVAVGELGLTVRCRVPASRENGNHFGAVHAAIQFAVTELAGGLAAGQCEEMKSGNVLLVVKSFNIRFLKPAMTDLEAVATVTEEQLRDIDRNLQHKGRYAFEIEISLLDDAQQVVALATGEYHAAQRS